MFLAYIVGTSQSYDSLATVYWGDDTLKINQKDSLGREHGNWIYYKKFNHPTEIDFRLNKLSYGKYTDGVKIGLWTYVNDARCYVEIIKTERYKSDGSYVQTGNEGRSFSYYSPQNKLLKVELYRVPELENDSVIVYCKKESCQSYFNGVEFNRFSIGEVHWQIDLFMIGEYSKELKIIKLNN